MPHDFGKTPSPPPSAPVARSGGRAPSVRSPQSSVLPHRANVPFFLKFHPMRWQWKDGEWLPRLGKLYIDPGVGGVDKRGDILFAETDERRAGWSILPWECVPEGTPNGAYIAEHDCATGKFYCQVWETPRHIGNRVLSSVIDRGGYTAFLRWLVAEGHVPKPDPAFLEHSIQAQEWKIQSMQSASHRPDVAEKLKAERVQLAAMSSPIDSKPKKKRASRKKAAPKKAAPTDG